MISVIVPMYNEAEGVEALYARLIACAESWEEPVEFIFINDGSQDETLTLCLRLAQLDHRVKVLSFSRNFGHQAALTAGLCYSTGDIITSIDADLQDPPEEILQFIKKCREGYDLVYAVRKRRKEGPWKRAAYWAYYRLLAALADIDIPLDSGDFCVMSRRLVETLNSLPERSRFLRGLRVWVGYRSIGLEYERQERKYGSPKYTFAKLMTLALDGMFNFSFKPLRIIMVLGLALGVFSFIAGMFVFYQYVTDTTIFGYNPRHARGWTSLILSVLFLSGMQLIGMGILGEYLGRLFSETKGRPMYIVALQAGFGHENRLLPGDRLSHGFNQKKCMKEWLSPQESKPIHKVVK